MKGHLLHNIQNSENKNERKIKTQTKTCFDTRLGKKMNFKPYLLPMY